ncbi:MAG: pyruvate formate lyase-activating protein [Ruminococcaceae bacterium]|nr:pyruvate formate lyase-activating protein [Oscillospiraceae bacterium]
MIGRIHSLQSLGTVDGPGVRFVVFLQGCNLRCGCCHNPDTWSIYGGTEIETDEIFSRVLRCREYFGDKGGVTVSGGEPLLQAGFVTEFFSKCCKSGINTCLDTSGSIINEYTNALLDVTDRVLLDIKYTTDKDYKENVGCSIAKPLKFLEELERRQIPTWLRQVTIPTKTDDEENILRLRNIAKLHKCVEKVELLPFRKMCLIKYNALGITFPFGDLPEPSPERMEALNKLLISN